MGWASGSSLFTAVSKAAKRFIKDPKDRRKFYVACLEAFLDHDWDTQQECEGIDPVLDRVLLEKGYIEPPEAELDEETEEDDEE
jgi:hypothetical protein